MNDTRDAYGNGIAEVGAAMVDDDHCPIGQITYRLVGFLAFLHQREIEFISVCG